MATPDCPALTTGEAYIWARRFRRLGFSPVTRYPAIDGPGGDPVGGYWLRCNWPYAVETLPLDLLEFFSAYDPTGFDSDVSPVHWVRHRYDAHRLRAAFRTVRSGMGTRPFAAPAADEREPPFVPAGRLRSTYDDWPETTRRHPDFPPNLLTATGGPWTEAARRAVALTARRPGERCPCCGYVTLRERGKFAICPVCFWEDDWERDVYGKVAPERVRGPNHVHLWQARENFRESGAAEERNKGHVRPPLPHEIPGPASSS